MKKNKIISLISLPLAMALLTGCGNSQSAHEHTFSEEWSFDSEMHWHQATCEHKELSSSLSTHIYNSDNVCTVCGRNKNAGKQSLKVKGVNCTVDNKTTFESVYGLDDYASIVMVANEGYVLPNNIRVYSGNEIILADKYTYALNANKKSADFVIKMDKSFEISVEAVEDIEVVYVGNHKITETGDYSYINPESPDKTVYYSKETNELTLRNAVISEDLFGSTTYTNRDGVNASYLITYMGTKPLTINLYGENNFIFRENESSFTKGVIVSRNCGDINLVGPGFNYVDGAGQGFIYSDGNVSIKDCLINSSNAGKWGIASRFLNIIDSTVGVYQGTGKPQEAYDKAIDASDCSIVRSVVDVKGFMNGLFATNLRFFSSKISVDSEIGINADWIYGYGERPIDDNFTTYLTIKGRLAGVRSFDLQEWQYCVLDVVCTEGNAISAADSTIRFYNSRVSAVSKAKGEGVRSFRMRIMNSEVYAESHATKAAAIRVTSLATQEPDPNKQSFLKIENSVIKAKSDFAAICGHGVLIVNNHEGFEDANNHYLTKNVGNLQWLNVWGLFPISTTEFDYELDHGSAFTAIPVGCTTSLTLDAHI